MNKLQIKRNSKLQDSAFKVEQVKNIISNPKSTLGVHNIAGKLGRKSRMQGGGRTQRGGGILSCNTPPLKLNSCHRLLLEAGKKFPLQRLLLFPQILGSVDLEYELHGKSVVLVYFNFIASVLVHLI